MNNEMMICTNCVMDETDPEISFDDHGVCNHCHNFASMAQRSWFPNNVGGQMLDALVDKMKKEGSRSEWDCVIGVSGGVDSSYLLHYAITQLKLRPLAIHVDAGWNSELAVANIKKLVNQLGVDLHTVVIDWNEMRSLQIAYLKSGLANQDVPQDHAFAATVFAEASKKGIKYILNGSNLATEGILPRAWGYDAMDSVQIRDIALSGGVKLSRYPLMSVFDRYVKYPFINGIQLVRPLNLMPYSKKDAISILSEKYGWEYYGGKHYESRWTQFFQSYWLIERFGYDKRKAHLASLVVSGEISREDALAELKKPAYDLAEVEKLKDFIERKLRIESGSLNKYLSEPRKDFSDYKNCKGQVEFFLGLARKAARIKRAIIGK